MNFSMELNGHYWIKKKYCQSDAQVQGFSYFPVLGFSKNHYN